MVDSFLQYSASDFDPALGAPPVFGLNQIVTQLLTSWGGSKEGTYRAWVGGNVTYSIADFYPTNAPYDEYGAYVMSATMKSVARMGFELWDDVININLNEAVNNPAANITMNWANNTYDGNGNLTTNGGTYARPTLTPFSGNVDQITAQQIWLNKNWTTHDQDSDMYFGGYGMATFVHEIGHTLGLSHPGTYNAGNNPITYLNNAEFAQDNRQYTIMSYFGGYDPVSNSWQQDGTSSSWYYPQTPMVYDIAAIQFLYGADYTVRSGNSTYGFNVTADVQARSANGIAVFNFAQNAHPIFTIWDGGGIDLLDASGYSATQIIDLTPGAYSSVGGMNYNIAIALNCYIENVSGGSGKDTIIGNAFSNTIWGNNGNDLIIGMGGDDIVLGGAGNDTIHGISGFNTIVGEAGNDLIYGGTGIDHISGGNDHDQIFGYDSNDILFGDQFFNVTGNDTIYGGNGDDIISGETFTHSDFGMLDVLYGDAGNDTIYGAGGTDWIFGGDGVDVIDGGAGADFIVGGGGGDIMLGSGNSIYAPASAGGDLFSYSNLWDGGDQIYGFDFNAGTGRDGIDFRPLFTGLGISGINPRGTGYLYVVQNGADTQVYVDPNGFATGQNLVLMFTLFGATASQLTDSYFLFHY